MVNHWDHRWRNLGVVAVTLLLAALSPLQAGTLTGTLTVTATVGAAACTSISASPLSFGSVSPSATASATSTVTVTCASGASYSIGAIGSTVLCISSTVYNVMGTTTSPSNIPGYQLFKDAAHSSVLSNNPSGGINGCGAAGSYITGTGSGSAQTQTIYGLLAGTVPGNTSTSPAGSYSDTATVFVLF